MKRLMMLVASTFKEKKMRNLVKGVFVVMALALAGEARGEWTLELFSGPSFTNSEVKTKGEPTVKREETSTRTGNTTSIRGRYFFPLRTTEKDLLGKLQYGIGTEISYLAMRGGPSLLGPSLTPIQFLFRYPLAEKFHFYLSVGPIIFGAKSVKNEFATDFERSHAVGLNTGAGLEIPLSEKIFFSAEYRYLDAAFQFDKVGTIVTPPIFNPIIGAIVDPADINVSQALKLRSHSVLLGIGYKF